MLRSAHAASRVACSARATSARVVATQHVARTALVCQQRATFAKKPAGGGGGGSADTSVDPAELFKGRVGQPPIQEAKTIDDIPKEFLDMYHDWKNKTGEFRPVDQMDSTDGRLYVRKIRKQEIRKANQASKKD